MWILPVACNVIAEPIPAGLKLTDLSDYTHSRAAARRRASLVSRRVVVGAMATLMSPNAIDLADAQAAALIEVLIKSLALTDSAIEVGKKIANLLGVGNRGSSVKTGPVLQYVASDLIIQSSQAVVIEVPAGVSVNLKLMGPSPSNSDASSFGSNTALSQKSISIKVGGRS